MTADLDVLVTGRADDRVVGTCVVVRDGDRIVVVDPGMVADRRLLLDPLAALGVSPVDVTDVVISHHHPDHTVNIALFPEVNLHDVATTYRRDLWIDREEGPFDLTASIRLLPTPGHTAEDVTTLVETTGGLVALTHPVVDGRRSGRRPVRARSGRAPAKPRTRPGSRPCADRSRARRAVHTVGLDAALSCALPLTTSPRWLRHRPSARSPNPCDPHVQRRARERDRDRR